MLGDLISQYASLTVLPSHQFNDLSRCDPEIQTLIAAQTFETLITSQDGMTISRALVNVIIDQQIGQQISVSLLIHPVGQIHDFTRSTQSVKSYNTNAVRSAVLMT